ncbi:branched-chain amino acid ABC transporter permease [Pseudorhodoplanes sp.]|uniref:branched-chain amino acid ABC transporter permease n=1 Tax=Pseudorhodoplanes sp. TaxID=1934341 RepID=UPI002BA900A9|nr:branched-chain amino acid ABC transporter permease [Pseudorhodoplanes sp.]HWV44308.1 branched-chain amino acid ABC transporter permease [Pseudorhodoplanes sp.]
MPEIIDKNRWLIGAFVLVGAALALLPLVASSYTISFLLLMFANVALATAWSFFSGATRYISLATASFFGIGIYTLAITHVYIPVGLALVAAAVISFLVAIVIGLSTLRLRGVYFVVFTFGLTELVHQVINWWEIKINKTATRYIFSDVSNVTIYLTLLAVAFITIVGSWYVSQSRLGYALRAIGEDETVARHTGINTTWVKVLCFALSASAMALVGATLALRYPYIDASIAFNNSWSFQVLIAALLGGVSRYWGPMVGAIPLVLLSEFLAGTFPHHFSIALGLCFVVIVYFIPGGLAPLIESYWYRLRDTLRTKKAATA